MRHIYKLLGQTRGTCEIFLLSLLLISSFPVWNICLLYFTLESGVQKQTLKPFSPKGLGSEPLVWGCRLQKQQRKGG